MNLNFVAHADVSGIYVGGGLGLGMQHLSANGSSSTLTSPAIRATVGYQFASWVGGELGYTYITQADNWNNYGNSSSVIYDFAFTGGYTLLSIRQKFNN